MNEGVRVNKGQRVGKERMKSSKILISNTPVKQKYE